MLAVQCAAIELDGVVGFIGACLQARMEEARALFRNPDTTEFVIVTIPTVMAAAESARLAKALRTEKVPVNSILINQVSTLPLWVLL